MLSISINDIKNSLLFTDLMRTKLYNNIFGLIRLDKQLSFLDMKRMIPFR